MEEGTPPEAAALWAMKKRAVFKRAEELGVPEADLDEAGEAAYPKAAAIALILAQSARARLREELMAMKQRAVFKRAEQLAVSEAELDEADEAADPKAAAIALIMGLPAPAPAAGPGPDLAEPEPEAEAWDSLASYLAHAVGLPEPVVQAYAAALEQGGCGSVTLLEGLSIVRLTADYGWKRGHALKLEKFRAEHAAAEPQLQVITRDVHTAGADRNAGGAAAALPLPVRMVDYDSQWCIFGSMRFPVPPEARALCEALKAYGVHMHIVEMQAGADIDEEVYQWIEHCNTFFVFGTHHYGEDTGNSACTYKEVKVRALAFCCTVLYCRTEVMLMFAA